MDIRGAVVLVTGASEGIGRAVARRFAAEGAHVALAARSAERLEALAGELRAAGHEALVVPADLRDAGQIDAMVQAARAWKGRLDVLVNNAGQAVAGTAADVSLADVRQVMELNVFGAWATLQAAVRHMRAGGGGLILNVSSMVTRMTLPGLSGYTASKAALNALSEAARLELAPENIRVVLVLPRLTATDFGRNSLGDPATRARQRAGSHANVVVDSAEHVAERMLVAVRDEPAEQQMA
jgi:short-subunit dehydrogenase